MDFTNIRPMLHRECSFRDPRMKVDELAYKRQMMGLTSLKFCVSWIPSWENINRALVTHRRWMEMLNVSKAITSNFPNPTCLKVFCDTHAEKLEQDKYNLFMEGEEANYWISAQTIPGHYEVKVHSITKEGS